MTQSLVLAICRLALIGVALGSGVAHARDLWRDSESPAAYEPGGEYASDDDFLTIIQGAPAGRVGDDYEAMLVGGGTGYYHVNVTGNLPPGLSIDAEGRLSGVPEAAGTYRFKILVNDESQPPEYVRGAFAIRIFDAR